MAFWTSSDAEPKRKFRFKLQMFSNEIIWYCKSISAPSFEISSIEHHFSDHVFHYPGKIKWNDVTVVLIDPGGTDDVVKKTMGLLLDAGYKIPSNGSNDDDFSTFAKSDLVDNNGSVVLSALDEEGAIIEDWNLHNAFITGVKFGDFDYSSEDMREIEITFKYDWASCKVGEGAAFFRNEG